MKTILSCLLIAFIMTGCSVCKPTKANDALRESLPFKKMKIELVSEDHKNCTYLFSVTAKEFKTPKYFKVERIDKQWVSKVVNK